MWATDGLEFDAVQLRFAQRVSEALRTVLARLRTESPDLADSITTRLSQACEAVISRVLLSPSVSQQLLWGGDSAAGTGRFLENCLRMEAVGARENAIQNGLPIWGALGNCVVRETGELARWDPVDGRLPVDLESPDAIALGSTLPTEAVGWTPLKREEQRLALETLTAACLRVRRGGASLQALMETCARVIVMRRKPTKLFYSFSSCYSVGRIALVNPQLVSEALIAEALVHEAIHAYLYMHEPTPLWGVKPGVRDEPGTAQSPWTGRALPVCTFLHACFVWYGLFFFWGQVMCSSHAPAEEARRGIARASAGFMKGPILDQLGPERIGSIRQEVQAALAEMQQNVLAVVG
ncbi:HEXXH motif-containing putative peptide modification protein [Mesorhizobium sp. M0408]|uniref:aKG-HExxH-type peptide beta-hydroxylase n=1 Tax=Mesorhizobium sp. M0408 TaxID=2956942 RepID=UPI00333BAC4C